MQVVVCHLPAYPEPCLQAAGSPGVLSTPCFCLRQTLPGKQAGTSKCNRAWCVDNTLIIQRTAIN